MITVILNGYKRPKNLEVQLEAVRNQTIKPDEILLWYNNPGDDSLINYEIGTEIPAAYCNYNFGVWARFYFALNAKNPYVCIIDDDTIPGSKWFENCLETMKTHEGMLSSVGLLYPNPLPPQYSSYYEHYIRFGWPPAGNNETPVRIDVTGHNWFFKKEWLSHMFRELPDPKYNICGEDMHFSFMLQKYAGIHSYVPPHPRSDKELWGSIHDWGGDNVSLWETNTPSIDGTPFKQLMNEFFRNQRLAGWKLAMEK